MIKVTNLSHSFSVYQKAPGLKGSLLSLFKRKYIEKKALININFTVAPGEMIGLIGANGAGKTTLIKILSGIIHPHQGEVSVLGFHPWHRDYNYLRHLSVIMGQKSQLWWDLPAYDSFLLLKEIYQIPTLQFQTNLNNLCAMLQIKEQLNIQVRRLSLGERMKVELIASLLHDPKVIFLDEPTIGLDYNSQKAVRVFLREYQKQYQPMIILTSHYIKDIEELCPKILLMKEGEIIYNGSLNEIQKKYSIFKQVECRISNILNEPLKIQTASLSNYFLNEKFNFKDLQYEPDKMYLKFLIAREDIPRCLNLLFTLFEFEDFNINESDVAEMINQVVLNHGSKI